MAESLVLLSAAVKLIVLSPLHYADGIKKKLTHSAQTTSVHRTLSAGLYDLAETIRCFVTEPPGSAACAHVTVTFRVAALRIIESPKCPLSYKRLIVGAGLEYVKHKTAPQKMRRTFASFIEAAGGNATRALKHVDRRVTEDSYLESPHRRNASRKRAAVFLGGNGVSVTPSRSCV